MLNKSIARRTIQYLLAACGGAFLVLPELTSEKRQKWQTDWVTLEQSTSNRTPEKNVLHSVCHTWAGFLGGGDMIGE